MVGGQGGSKIVLNLLEKTCQLGFNIDDSEREEVRGAKRETGFAGQRD